MAIPKKTKFRFQHLIPYQRGGRSNQRYLLAKGNEKVKWGEYGLQAQQGAEISEQQIEAVRKVVSRYTKKFVDGKHKPWKINIFPHSSKTKKPLEVRMGSGKGSIDKWKAVVKVGTVMIELSKKVPKDIAYEALRQANYKLKVSGSKIIQRHE